MNEMEEKILRLPRWAQEHIRRLEIRSEPAMEEASRSRRKVGELETIVRRQKDRIEAMVAMFQCAAKGGNEIAQAVKSIVEDYIVSDSLGD